MRTTVQKPNRNHTLRVRRLRLPGRRYRSRIPVPFKHRLIEVFFAEDKPQPIQIRGSQTFESADALAGCVGAELE